MDNAALPISIGTIIMVIPYIYFYLIYREKYMGIWILSWFIFCGRLVFFDYGPFTWKNSDIALTFFQFIIIINGLTFAWGSYVFVGRHLDRKWIYASFTIFALSLFANLAQLSLFLKIFPPLGFACFVCIWIGRIFTKIQPAGIGALIAGYSLILWGMLTLAMPYTVSISWLSPWCYFAGTILRLFIVLGILLVYLEKTRADLAQKEKQYRLLAENAVDVIYRYNLSPITKFEYISPAAFLITGYTPEEYYNDPELLCRLVHPEDRSSYESFTKEVSYPCDIPLTFRLINKANNIIWIEQKCIPIFDDGKKVVAIEGILRDVTARKAMEQVVGRVEQMNLVGQMAASLAHEIRNPLTSVRGYLQMMKLKGESWIHQDRYDLMISELDRTNEVITEYLLLAKDKVSNLEKLSINNVINAILPLLHVTAGATNVSIKVSLQDVQEIYLDKNEIRQLIFNLVNNGMQAMSNGGELFIRTYMEQDKIVLSIRDQGKGIPPEILANLGRPFITTKSSGTGLGLPVCYRIAHRHKASINVDTSDKGTIFHVKFPLS